MAHAQEDRVFLNHALRLAQRHSTAGHGGPFGALVVAGGTIIGQGWNKVTSTSDPTAHAEMVAIRSACRMLKQYHLLGSVLYSSCEPCPMCLAAAYWARVERIVFAAARSDAAAIGFDDEFLYREIPLARDQRKLPMSQLLRGDAIKIMNAWYARPNRMLY
jgi:guanine deaminase